MELIRMRVGARRALTPQITEFTLVPMEEGALPGFTPGAHVTVETPSGAMRRYSLVNDGTAPDHYKIAVKREPASRGGSASMHDEAVEGFELNVEAPENDFPMADAPRYLLIAGGIGVTRPWPRILSAKARISTSSTSAAARKRRPTWKT
jgi:phthalate 4,5-dioxygenase reductase subunit